MEEQKIVEIPVWVDGTQKWVTGLTKRTTCDDVIYALLYNEGKHDHDSTDKYTIFERWRDVERPLQGRTKIIKIWRAWGAEQYNVQLTMKNNDEPDYYGEFLHNRRRHRRTRHKRSDRQSRARTGENEYHSATSRLKSMEHLAKVVISQERQLHDIVHRIEDTDKRIDNIETNMHYTRMAENGQNYLQNAYLDNGFEDSMDEFLRDVDPENIEMYIEFCERVINLEQKIHNETSKIGDLSHQIQENSLNEGFCGDDETENDSGRDLEEELAKLQVELNRIVSANMMQKYQAVEITKEIDLYDKALATKQDVIKTLQKEIENLELFEQSERDCQSKYMDVATDDHVQFPVSAVRNHPPSYHQYKKQKDPKEPEYVNIDAIIGLNDVTETTSLSDTKDTGRGDSFDSRDLNKKNTSDLEDSFSVDTDNTSNDSQFGTTSCIKHSSPIDKYSCQSYSRLSETASFRCDELISERIKSEIYVYKSTRSCCVNKNLHSAGAQSDDRYCFSKHSEDIDSNSDTGLSSMHSDESPTYLETLV